MAHRRLRQVELLGRTRDAAEVQHGHECTQGVYIKPHLTSYMTDFDGFMKSYQFRHVDTLAMVLGFLKLMTLP
jgi:hypothetical protein